MRAHLARVDAVLVQAVIAAALSFAHIHDLAEAAGQGGWKAWAYPVSVDLLLVAAWRRLRTSDTGKTAGWCWFLVALAASLGANVATAGLLDLNDVPVWLRILVGGWPAVAFLGGTLLAHTTTDTQPEAPKTVPERPPLAVPAALLEHARKVAAEHHARTGKPIDTATLRARLGVPSPVAEAIATHLV
ncbi:DUF2637 domain-containing protein [Streptomyces litchfieldiae]|uniref:DUF2637 domain-containing protein n=1 Tax=Streptomyces litchfieldiae TaxID=3075543 RepID=A0ABU2MJZ8_9ACTN|nr:DUF2637 domain-containing protein [Streptomyces sp. DSM 44938]MDT0341914.1 DUF2637 domain-containing protein [Streptomyces sp. DSM 44938]